VIKRVWAALCDRCGFRFDSDKLRKEWTGHMVCHECWEPRHPQDFVRVPHEEIVPPWTRPYPTDVFTQVCTEYTIQSIADVGTADCMIADYVNLSIFQCTVQGTKSFPGLSIAGCMIAGRV
jgi:hypothetical protein